MKANRKIIGILTSLMIMTTGCQSTIETVEYLEPSADALEIYNGAFYGSDERFKMYMEQFMDARYIELNIDEKDIDYDIELIGDNIFITMNIPDDAGENATIRTMEEGISPEYAKYSKMFPQKGLSLEISYLFVQYFTGDLYEIICEDGAQTNVYFLIKTPENSCKAAACNGLIIDSEELEQAKEVLRK